MNVNYYLIVCCLFGIHYLYDVFESLNLCSLPHLWCDEILILWSCDVWCLQHIPQSFYELFFLSFQEIIRGKYYESRILINSFLIFLSFFLSFLGSMLSCAFPNSSIAFAIILAGSRFIVIFLQQLFCFGFQVLECFA